MNPLMKMIKKKLLPELSDMSKAKALHLLRVGQ